MAKLTKADLDPADLYVPPASKMAASIQYPIDARWQNRVLNAYVADGRKTGRAALREVSND